MDYRESCIVNIYNPGKRIDTHLLESLYTKTSSINHVIKLINHTFRKITYQL